MTSYKITIIGTGNVASHLAPAFEKAGHAVHEIYGRSEEKVLEMSEKLYNPVAVDSLDFSASRSDVFLIAVSDSAIETLASEIVLPDNSVVAHTSGSVSLSVLELTASDRYGVFYPLQSFSKERKVNLSQVPILIEGNDRETSSILQDLARSVTSGVLEVSSDDRGKIHLSAVFASNFTNHMLHIAEELMDKSGMDFEILEPLIRETMEKALSNNPGLVQTGPALREDDVTMQKHLEMLSTNKDFEQLYRLISQSILGMKN